MSPVSPRQIPALHHGTSGNAADTLSRSPTPAQSQRKDNESTYLTEYLPYDSGDESPAELQDGSVRYALSRQTISQVQVNTQLNKRTPSIQPECPVCGKKFHRAQERDRHLKSYLPHSIYCPSQGCPWTGRRRWDLKTHWERKHSGTGQVLGGEKNKIYDPKEFVKLIADGSSHVEVAESAFLKANERLKKLGKVGVGANVLGRKLDIEM